jgi:hypothetical protein
MKTTISITLVALLATFSSCKKDYTDYESYSTSYQTSNDTLRITVKGSLGVNDTNGKLVKLYSNHGTYIAGQVTEITPKAISYKAVLKNFEGANLSFFKLDGSVIMMHFIKSDKVLNTNF